MRWFRWAAVILGLLLLLWVGAFAALFQLGPEGVLRYAYTGRASFACPWFRTWTYPHVPQFVWAGNLLAWRPLISVWATSWGARRLHILAYASNPYLTPAEVDLLLHGRL